MTTSRSELMMSAETTSVQLPNTTAHRLTIPAKIAVGLPDAAFWRITETDYGYMLEYLGERDRMKRGRPRQVKFVQDEGES